MSTSNQSSEVKADSQAAATNQFNLFALAFRPFFLAGSFAGAVLMLLWLLVLSGQLRLAPWFDINLWHAHEMIFGFAGAVIAGFLLTAVQAWTGIPGVKGTTLVLLVLLWLCGRLLMLFPLQVFPILNVLVDLAFIPAVAVILASFVVRAKQWRNGIFIPLLGLFVIANMLVHLQVLGLGAAANVGLNLGLWLILLLIIILGGRVLPMFTSNGLGGVEVHSWRFINIGSIVFFILLVFADLFGLNEPARWLAGVCVVFHGIRLHGWRPLLTLKTPLLWVLHIGYAWLIIGFSLYALSEALSLPRSVAIHAFAVGTIGNFIIGMMSRVALGHTGRQLIPASIMTLAYIMVNLAAMIRVLLPLLVQLNWLNIIVSAGVVWILAYSIFFAVYTPILCRPRVDGNPG